MSDQAQKMERIRTHWEAIKDPFLMDLNADSTSLSFQDAAPNLHETTLAYFKELGLDPLSDASYDQI